MGVLVPEAKGDRDGVGALDEGEGKPSGAME